ncbi:MAG: FliG C-terminal domain-containing protein [Caenibius sp.]
MARAIEAEMFTFEMLAELDSMGMGLLRDVENEVLVDALKAGRDRAQAVLLPPCRAAPDGLRDEIELRGKLRRADMLGARSSGLSRSPASWPMTVKFRWGPPMAGLSETAAPPQMRRIVAMSASGASSKRGGAFGEAAPAAGRCHGQ